VLVTWVLIVSIYKRKKREKRRKEKRKMSPPSEPMMMMMMMMMMMDGTILWWWGCAWLFVVVLFIVLCLPSVIHLEVLYDACSRNFVIFCTGASGGWGWSQGVSQVVVSPFLI